MTPRRLDWVVIVEKLQMMRRLLDELDRLGPVDVERFVQSFATQLLAERIILALVDLAGSINAHVVAAQTGVPPSDVQSSFADASDVGLIDHGLARRLAPSAGLRNVLVHAYIKLDLARLVAAVPLAAEQYGEYVRQVARWVADRSG
jgi:uncharacterized protein YutE (UPF0331/DUF86 family)